MKGMSSEKANTLADEVATLALKQLRTSFEFKIPRVQTIKKYRRLYNGYVPPKLRQQFNVPLPVFPGMIDTLQADLDDTLIIEYEMSDPADWKRVEKANAALTLESKSARPGAQWEKKFRQYRFEKIITGRGVGVFNAEAGEDGYHSELDIVPFEDFFFEPMGGGNLENHIFAGRQNVWRTAGQLAQGVRDGIYSSSQVNKITAGGGRTYKLAPGWDGEIDTASRFRSLGLNPEGNNYVGEEVYNFCEWVTEYKGRRWYLFFDAYSGEWARFEKNSDVRSSDEMPFFSSASHEDLKNFASKSFCDDLYPIADSIITLFNQDLTNRQKRNLNAKAYDRSMFKDVGKLDEAQYRPDALVPVETFGGTRRISEGLFSFETPEITGTVDLISWLEGEVGKQVGVTDMQQGAPQPATKKVGVAYAESAQISKRLSFTSKPFTEMGQQLGDRFFCSLKDYMREPMSIELLGEDGVEFDVLRRVDLNVNRDFKITVSSQMQKNNATEEETQNQVRALSMTAGSPNLNLKVRDEMVLRKIGKFSEHDIALLMDPTADTDKETLAEVAGAIQDIIIRGKKPKTNWNADRYFVKRLVDFAKQHRDTLSARKFQLLMQYAQEHMQIAADNVPDEAKAAVQSEMAGGPPAGPMPAPSGAPGPMPARPAVGGIPAPAPAINV